MAVTRIGDLGGAERVPFGRYELLQLLAATRLGGVHRAESNEPGKTRTPVAIKWVKPALSADPAIATCFTAVMERARRLEHAGFVPIVDVDRAPDGSLFAAFEWVNGKDWKRIIAALRKQGQAMSPALVAYVGMRAAQALDVAHRPSPKRGVPPQYHGELSGADILIGYDGRVRLCGLGSFELARAAQLPAVRTAFRAPELERGAPCSAQTDVFSLGACLYQALALTSELGNRSSSADGGEKTQSLIRHIVPPALLEIVRRAVAEDPAKRFASAGELAAALAQWASSQTAPGDPHALSAFMGQMFEQARSGPMNDAREKTPAQPLRARRLAESMRPSRVADDPAATTPTPVTPIGKRAPRAADAVGARPTTGAKAPTADAKATSGAPATPMAPIAKATAATPATPVAAIAKATGDTPVTPLTAPAETANDAPAAGSIEDDWEREPWENAQGSDGPWSAAPATPTATPSAITSRPPARARAAEPVAEPSVRPLGPVPMPARPQVAPALAQSLPPQPVALPPVSLGLPEEGLLGSNGSRAAWRMPAFVAAGVLLVLGALFGLRSRAPEPASPSAAAPRQASAAASPLPAPSAAPATAELVPPSEPTELVAAAAPRETATEPSAKTSQEAPEPEREAPRREVTPGVDSTKVRAARAPREPATPPREDDARTADPFARNEPAEAPEPIEAAEPAAAEVWTPSPQPVATPRATPPPEPERAAIPDTPEAPAARIAPKPSVVQPAVAIEQPAPDFPSRAKRRDVTEGTVTVEYTIDETGAVRDPRILESTPKGLFDASTLAALQHWRYRPKLVDGKPVASRKTFTFHFK